MEIFPEATEAQLIALAQVFDRNAGEMFALREQNAEMKAQLDAVAAEKALLAAVKDGSIPEERIDKSVKRILELKMDYGITE